MLSKLYGYLLGALGLVAAVFTALGLAKRSGVKEQQAKDTEKALEQAKEASAIDSKVHGMSDAAVTDGLSKYTRKE